MRNLLKEQTIQSFSFSTYRQKFVRKGKGTDQGMLVQRQSLDLHTRT